MSATSDMIDARMAEHKAWQDAEAERQTEELWSAMFGYSLKAQKAREATVIADYKGLSKETKRILKGLGE
jgi:hypothetical protein